MPKRIRTSSAPGSSKAITLTLKSTRNPVLDVTLDKVPLSTTSIQDLKEAVQARVKPAGSSEGEGEGKVPLEKIKILWKRKPVQGRTVEEALAGETALLGGGGKAEFGVMVLGGAVALSEEEVRAMQGPVVEERERETPTRPAEGEGKGEDVEMKDAAQGVAEKSAGGVLDRAEFWDELQVFLRTKVGDEQEADRLKKLFKGAWELSK